ncbi:hypothetical protein [Amycolatopsis pithecellobii]|uniref:Uncharacterized protein n=1 Tax=Amycolatopsis pithecellobii TaxID=664692 RepID=A0A6N7Z806_9PSEU|nr:hypothetical protein [Amycolatopsis pithecellobii]MTD57601.1 hypothetical protein [Amycolatopsis pithecellobii]
MKSVEAQARELAASSGRSYEDALRLVRIEHQARLTVADASFALGHPVAVLADSGLEPSVTGTTGLGPHLRDVRIGYGGGTFPDIMVVTSIPLPGEKPDENLLATVLHNFLVFHDTRREDAPDRRLTWQQATAATPVPVEVSFAGTETPATQLTVGRVKAVRVPYLTGQVVIGSHGTGIPALALTGEQATGERG